MPEKIDISNQTERIRQLEDELTAYKQREYNLKTDILRYEMAASGARDGLWDWDMENDIKYASQPFKKMLGYEEDGYDPNASSSFESLLHPEESKKIMTRMKSLIMGNETSFSHELRLKHKDGSYPWFLSKASISRNESGMAIRMSGSLTDITNQKLSKEALERSENKFRSLFENSMVGMFRAYKDDSIIKEGNLKFWELLAIEPSNRKGRTLKELCANEVECGIMSEIIQSEGQLEGREVEMKRDNGEVIWVLFSVTTSATGKMLECVIKDITETRNNFLELQKANFELDSFVYHASHDLRSPLRSVLGLIGLYRMDDNARNREECIEKMEKSIKRLDSLVIELLSISRNNRIDDPMVPIHLMDEVSNSVASYSNTMDSKSLEVLSNIKQPMPFISDVTRVRIILNNLISNAIKYRSYDKKRSFVQINVTVDNEKAKIVIEDNGEGIPESKIDGVFDMFFRATEKSEGSGLGLYIVKNVAQKLNATLNLESEELEGTKFTVEIPNHHSPK